MRCDLFRRARRVTAYVNGEKILYRGTVQKLKEDKTEASPETGTFGGGVSPLYVYFGDGERLCGAENAALEANGVRYRVLYAQKKYGLSGEFYVRAVLEKEESDDGDGA